MTHHPRQAEDRPDVDQLLVPLALAVAAMSAALLRRRAVTSRPGAFKGKVRLVEGPLEGFSRDWQAGYGHWARDVLVWNTSPFLLRTRLIAVEATDVSGIHPTANGAFAAALITARRSRLEIAAAAEDRDVALGPFARAPAVGSLVRARFDAEDSAS